MTPKFLAIALLIAAGALLLAATMLETEIVRLALRSFLETQRFGGVR